MSFENIKNRQKYEAVSGLTKEKIESALRDALKVIDKNLEDFTTYFPSESSNNNIYEKWENDKGWGTGFWTGILWIAYELTGEEKYKKTALLQLPSYEKRIKEKLAVDHHDMGFLFIPSCVAAYKLTGDEYAKDIALMAADNLMKRYHEKGEFLQAWGELGTAENYRLIIDCMLNIPLLYWASEVTQNRKYEEAAYKHYKTTAKHILREDGSTFHTFYFDTVTGKAIKGVTAQGRADDSCWARGQAWGIYGFMLTYMYKKNPDAIGLFKAVANYFLNRLPDDYIAYWDLSFTSGNEERDSSSAAIAACGLIEGANCLDDDDADKMLYMRAAEHIMDSFIDNYTTKNTPLSNGLLLHGVYTKPGNVGVDECNIWGDYFYMEALARLIKGKDFHAYW